MAFILNGAVGLYLLGHLLSAHGIHSQLFADYGSMLVIQQLYSQFFWEVSAIFLLECIVSILGHFTW